jgi:16S rRNA (cytidine1402-2'-O)-methyltransferase
LPTDSFFFAGFLPSQSTRRKRKLLELAGIPATLILYEAPHRLAASLADMIAVLGPRRATLARELTKIHEEFLSGTLPEILETIRPREKIRGEIVIVIDRGEPAVVPVTYPDSIRQHLADEMRETGLSRNEALKSVARQRGIPRKEAYRMVLEEK